MNNFIMLVKIQLKNLFTNSSMRMSSKKKGFGYGAIILPALLFIYMSVSYTSGMMLAFPSGEKDTALYLIALLAFIMLTIFAFYSANGHLFGFKDYDLLSSLPISKVTIITSKLVSFWLLEFVYCIFLYYPALVIVGISESMSLSYYILGILGGLFLPLIPIILSSFFSLIINFISKHFKYRHLVNTILSVLMIFGVFAASFSLQYFIGDQALNTIELKRTITKFLPFIGLLIQGSIEANFFLYLIGITISLVPFILFINLFAKRFSDLNSIVNTGYKVKNYQLRSVKGKSVMKALLIKEIRRYFTCGPYVINTTIGPIMMALASIYLMFQRDVVLYFLESMPLEIRDLLFVFLLLAVAGFCFTSCTTNASISLEGKHLWITKSAPVSTMQVFMAKINLNLLILVVPMSIGVLFIGITIQLSILEILLTLFAVLASSLLIAQFGLIINLNFPRLDWDREIYVVKQSMSVFVSIFGGLIFTVLLFFIVMNVSSMLSSLLLGFLINLSFVLLNVICWFYLKTIGIKQFSKL